MNLWRLARLIALLAVTAFGDSDMKTEIHYLILGIAFGVILFVLLNGIL